jgi:2-phosphosulfolactate phosphatase
MHIERLSLASGAEAACGIAVIIDVFRAFTCEPLLFHYGAREVILESDIAACHAFGRDVIRIGEHNELPLDGFDLTNSPSHIMARGRRYFEGTRIVHRTTSGVTGAVAASHHADEVLLASFVNARATARYIMSRNPETVSIVAMGIRSQTPAPEDDRCGDYIEHLLTGAPYDHMGALAEILAHETAQKFLRGDKPYLPKEDPVICLQRDLFDFALTAVRQHGILTAVMR